MKLSKLAALIEIAISVQGHPKLAEMCREYYQPYYYLMYLLAGEVLRGSIVELGVNRGYGLSSFAYGSNPGVKVIGLDLNVEPEFCPDNAEFHLISALPVPDFIEDVAILHIDTEHSYSNAQNEFMQYRCKLLPGAVVLFDDLHAMDDGVLRAFYELPHPKIQDDRLHPINGYGVLIYE
jgi:hypothetical protein